MSLLDRGTISPLFHGLFDDAALFPPGNAAMDDAVAGFERNRRSWYAELVSAFVCPSGRLAELDAEVGRAGIDALPVSVTVPSGVEDPAAAVRAATEASGLMLRAVELPVAAAELPGGIGKLQQLHDAGVQVYVEIAAADVSRTVAETLAAFGLGLKLRTGGSTAAAFPAVSALVGAIAVAVDAGVVFKCTAGLHHAVALDDPVTGLSHYGFLNVLLAVEAAQTTPGDPKATGLSGLLTSRDRVELADRIGALTSAQIQGLRERFRCIGSCSIPEPLTDLLESALVSAL